MPSVSVEVAKQIALEYLKKKKDTEKIDVSLVEQKNGMWILKGTCPIDLEGHPWIEKFSITVDEKGKIKSMDCWLL